MKLVKNISSLNETFELGKLIGENLKPSDLIILNGGLGAGKTTFTQAIGLALGVEEKIVSPTFTIAREYKTSISEVSLIHVDAYRIISSDNLLDELEELDLYSKLSDSIVVIEWGKSLGDALYSDRLDIEIALGHDEQREFTFRSDFSRWSNLDTLLIDK
jgi:tRNA threonylcarbamoyladenosine biosynthesis protein TsaE